MKRKTYAERLIADWSKHISTKPKKTHTDKERIMFCCENPVQIFVHIPGIYTGAIGETVRVYSTRFDWVIDQLMEYRFITKKMFDRAQKSL